MCVCKEQDKGKTEKTVSVAGIREAQSRELLWSLEQWKIHFTYIVAQKLEVIKHRGLTVLEAEQGTVTKVKEVVVWKGCLLLSPGGGGGILFPPFLRELAAEVSVLCQFYTFVWWTQESAFPKWVAYFTEFKGCFKTVALWLWSRSSLDVSVMFWVGMFCFVWAWIFCK